jgi:hypothetical protein
MTNSPTLWGNPSAFSSPIDFRVEWHWSWNLYYVLLEMLPSYATVTVLTDQIDRDSGYLAFEIDGIDETEFARIKTEVSTYAPLTTNLDLRLRTAPPVSDSYDDFSEYE